MQSNAAELVRVVCDAERNKDRIGFFEFQCVRPQLAGVAFPSPLWKDYFEQMSRILEPDVEQLCCDRRDEIKGMLELGDQERANAILKLCDLLSTSEEEAEAYVRYLMGIVLSLLECEKRLWNGGQQGDVDELIMEKMWECFQTFVSPDGDYGVMLMIQQFLYRILREFPLQMDVVFTKLSSLVNSSTEFFCFFDLFLRVVDLMPRNAVACFCRTNIWPRVTELAVQDVSVFTFVQRVLTSYDCHPFDMEGVRVTFLDFVRGNYFDPVKTDLVVDCLGILFCQQEILEDAHVLVVTAVRDILNKAVLKEDCAGFAVLTVIENCLTKTVDETLRLAIVDFQILNNLVRLLRKYPDKFNDVFNVITGICMEKSLAGELLNENRHFFVDVVEIPLKDPKSNIEVYKRFVCNTEVTKDHPSLVAIWRALPSCLSLAQIKIETEKDMVQWMIEIAKYPANAYELHQGDLPTKILMRLRQVQADDVLRKLYLDLYQYVSTEMFNGTTFTETIRLLRDVHFQYQKEILDIIRNLISVERDSSQPESFFQFRQARCGIHCHLDHMPECFSLVISLRIFNLVANAFYTIFSCSFQNGGMYTVGLSNGRLVVRVQSTKKILAEVQADKYSPVCGKWFTVVVAFEKLSMLVGRRRVTLLVDGEKYSNKYQGSGVGKQSNPFYGAGHIHFMSPDDGPCRSLQADMGATYILVNPHGQAIPNLFESKLDMMSLNRHVLCQFLPSLVDRNKIYRISPGIRSVPFVGTTVPYMQTFRELLPSLGILKNILPILTRLYQTCDECNRRDHFHESNWFCERCGAMNVSRAREMLLSFFKLLGTIARTDQSLFQDAPYFLILSELFGSVPSDYIDEPLICHMITIVRDFESLDLRREYIKSCLNFDMIKNWQDETVFIYFQTVLALGMRDSPESFNMPICSMLSPYLDYDQSVRTTIDNFFLDFFRKYGCAEDFYWLLVHAVSTEKPFHRIACLRYLSSFARAYPELFKKYGYYEPFLFFVNKAPENIYALQCIDYLLKARCDDINITRFAYQMTYWMGSSSEIENASDVAVFIDKWFFNKDNVKGLDSIQFFPLVAHFYSSTQKMKEEFYAALNRLVTNPRADEDTEILTKFFEVPYWIHWLYVLSGSDTQYFKDIVSLVIQSSNEKAAERTKRIKEMCMYCDLVKFETNVDLFKEIPDFLSKILSVELLSDEVLDFVLMKMMFTDTFFFDDSSYLEVPGSSGADTVPRFLNGTGTISWCLRTDTSEKETVEFAKHICSLLITDRRDVMINDRPVNMQVLAAYLIGKLLWSEKGTFDRMAGDLSSRLCNSDPKVQYQCYLFLENAIKVHKIDSDKAKEIEDNLSRLKQCSPTISDGFFDATFSGANEERRQEYSRFQLSFCSHFGEILKDVVQSDQTLLSEHCHKSFVKEIQAVAKKQMDDCRMVSESHTKTLSVFMRELESEPGAWAKSNDNKKFKLCKRISRTGMRTLMVINHNFTVHKEASERRDRPGLALKMGRIVYPAPVKAIRKLDNSGIVFSTVAIRRGLTDEYDGYISVKPTEIQFTSKNKAIKMSFSMIRFIANRRICNYENAIEVFLRNGESFMFEFPRDDREAHTVTTNSKIRKDFYGALARLKLKSTEQTLPGKFNFFAGLQAICGGLHQTVSSEELVEKLELGDRWVRREITTYEYLYYLNVLSGRTFCETYQYPVYPWLIQSNESIAIDLNDRTIYRDLTLPAAALSQAKLEIARQRLQSDDPESMFMWGECISSFGGLYQFLVRVEPFTTLHIEFQNGFDLTDRLYPSVARIYEDMTGSAGMARESIPEIYSLPQIYVNENGFDLGKTVRGVELNDLVLPNWASSSHHYTSVLRRGLETNFVGSVFGHWIDLVFGVHRCSREHDNVFPEWAYPERTVTDRRTRLYGCFPGRLFSSEHKQRNNCDIDSLRLQKDQRVRILEALSQTNADVIAGYKDFVFCQDSVFCLSTLKWKQLPISHMGVWAVSRAYKIAACGTQNSNLIAMVDLDTESTANDTTSTVDQHSALVTCAYIAGGEYLVTGSTSSVIRVYRLPSLQLESVSTHQSHSIIAIAANADLGLIVSITSRCMMVIQTLLDGRLINSVQYVGKKGQTKISIFKSGTIVVAQPYRITFFDVRGVELDRVDLRTDRKVPKRMATAKYYDYDTRELLLATTGTEVISVFDVATCKVLKQFHATANIILPLKGKRAFLAIGATTSDVSILDISDCLSSQVSRADLPAPSVSNMFASTPPHEIRPPVLPYRTVSSPLPEQASPDE